MKALQQTSETAPDTTFKAKRQRDLFSFFYSGTISLCLFAAASAPNILMAASLVRQDAYLKIKSKRTCSCWTVNLGGLPFLSEYVMPLRCALMVPMLTE